MKDIDRDIRELQRLKTKLNVGKTWNCYFDGISDTINITHLTLYCNSHIEDMMREPRWIFLVRTLLHEIGHAIDHKYNKEQMKNEMKKV